MSQRHRPLKHASISIHEARSEDLPAIVAFLSRPEIDRSFCKPLSQRDISIAQRVRLKDRQGVWMVAEVDGRIVSCLAIVLRAESVVFSTFACINDLKSKRAGGDLWEACLKLAKEKFRAGHIEIDSWAGNAFLQRFLLKRGFKKIKTFADPEKRPAAVKSVLYRSAIR